MSLKVNIEADLVLAIKNRNQEAIDALRLFKAALKNAEIAKKRELTEQEIIGLILTQIKRHKEAIDEYKKAGREDLLSREEEQLLVMEKYLPKQLDNKRLGQIVKEVIMEKEATSQKQFGLVMAEVMKRVRGQADGNAVKEVVEQALKELDG